MNFALTNPGLLYGDPSDPTSTPKPKYFKNNAERAMALAAAGNAAVQPQSAQVGGLLGPTAADDNGPTSFAGPTLSKAMPTPFRPSFNQANTDPTTGAPAPSFGNPATSKLGKLLSFLGALGTGAAIGSQYRNFGQGFQAAGAEHQQQIQEAQQQQQAQMANQSGQIQLQTQKAQLAMLPWQQQWYKQQQATAQEHTLAQIDQSRATTKAMNALANKREEVPLEQAISDRTQELLKNNVDPDQDKQLQALKDQRKETRPPTETNAQDDINYRKLLAQQNQGIPISKADAAWMKAYRSQKLISPAFKIAMDQSGGGLINPDSSAPPTIDSVPNSIRGTVQKIIDYRGPMPPAGRNNPNNTAIRYYVNKLDPTNDETTFPARNKLMTSMTSGQDHNEIKAINTALGHVGVLNSAIDALDNGNIKVLNSIANKFGLQTGSTPMAVFNTIIHRLGPELTQAYIKGGGSQGERGTTEADFDPSLGPKILKSNVAITARLLRSKIGATENNYQQTMKRDDFQHRFITPEAQQTLDMLSPESAGSGGGSGSSAGQGNSKAAKHGVPF